MHDDLGEIQGVQGGIEPKTSPITGVPEGVAGPIANNVANHDTVECKEHNADPPSIGDDMKVETIIESENKEVEDEEESDDDIEDICPMKTRTRAGRAVRTPQHLHDTHAMGAPMCADDTIVCRTISPDSQTPSVQSTFGSKPKQKRDYSFCNVQMTHHVMTQMSLKQGLKKWPEKTKVALHKEMSQMHHKSVFDPTHADDTVSYTHLTLPTICSV